MRQDWGDRPVELLDRLVAVIRTVMRATGLPVDVDLPPWIATRHPESFAAHAAAASVVTLLAYRDTAEGILRVSEDARRVLGATGRPYRVAVDTTPAAEPGTSFAGRDRAALDRALEEVSARIRDTGFRGVAVHDLAGWRALPGRPGWTAVRGCGGATPRSRTSTRRAPRPRRTPPP